MIKDRSELQDRHLEIDLQGEHGNAFALLGMARSLSTQLGLDGNAICAEMRKSDYDHLVKVFDKHFGDYATLYE